MRPTRYVLLSLTMFGLWLLLSGHYEPLIVGFGVFSSLLVTFIAWRMDREDRYAFALIVNPRLVLYWVWLIKEILKANVNVARLILAPSLPISPIMVPFKACMKCDLARMIYANSITLTPGTITTGTEGDILRIHALSWQDVDGREEDEMGQQICAVECPWSRRP
ncbi:MAG: Na+/H+ antiporter subunit E [Gemmatimonadetes bacterium]|nr:Na+/H+ antiporter subunit E [Gemmatimonadota bacterium]